MLSRTTLLERYKNKHPPGCKNQEDKYPSCYRKIKFPTGDGTSHGELKENDLFHPNSIPVGIFDTYAVKQLLIKSYTKRNAHQIFHLLVSLSDNVDIAKLVVWTKPENMFIRCLLMNKPHILNFILKCGFLPTHDELDAIYEYYDDIEDYYYPIIKSIKKRVIKDQRN